MSELTNPWDGMPAATQRRVKEDIVHDLFWMTDVQGSFGFYIQSPCEIASDQWQIRLNGIATMKTSLSEGVSQLFLVLLDKDDWEIFKLLCDDLISVANVYDQGEKLVDAIELRLRRWQQLLKQDSRAKLTLEVQMGLFSELLFLRDTLAPRIGFKQAVVSWVGPEHDKQDFLTDRAAVEVKSFRTSKGPLVSISSIQQLSSGKDYLFLVSYGLTQSENGLSISAISEDIRKSLNDIAADVVDLFDTRLVEYGYVPEIIKEPLIQFLVDQTYCHHVREAFPRLKIENISTQIVSVRYVIDLTQCGDYQVDLEFLTL